MDYPLRDSASAAIILLGGNLMLSRYCVLMVMTISCICGCNRLHDSATQTASNSDTTSNRDVPIIETGFFRPGGPDYERVSDVLAKSNASISLDYHQGIEWYDKSQKEWTKIEYIEDVKSLLAETETKKLIKISTGKAMWDKYDEYIAKIAEYASELGFRMTVVTDANAQGLIVSEVIQHEN